MTKPISRRRAVVASSLVLLGLGHRAVRGASNTANHHFLDLKSAVCFAAEVLDEQWAVVSFNADLSTAGGDRRLPGVLLNTGPGVLAAFCTICPHEICHVELVKETRRLEVLSKAVTDRPLFVCPCHFSLFDPSAQGAVISGPALRGLYSFAFEVTGNSICITGVEAGVLELFT